MILRIVCWNCQKTECVEVSGPIQYGFDLLKAAEVAGMKGYHDTRYGRVLVFCDAECAKQQCTKEGFFRKIPKREVKKVLAIGKTGLDKVINGF